MNFYNTQNILWGFLFFRFVFSTATEEYFCDRIPQNETDPALLKTYAESVRKTAKGCFSHAYNLSLQPEITQTSDNISIKIIHLVNDTATNDARRMPILLLHGLLGSSSVWLLSQQPTDLVFQLFQSNYDIWLGNERSNYFSVNKHLAPIADAATYWNYSWHEVGLKDLPAMIDYILTATNSKKLRIVCHSQGCTTFFVMASLMPEYAEKIAIVHALTPAIYLQHSRSPIISMAAGFFKKYKEPYNYAVAMNFHQMCLSSVSMLDRCIGFCSKVFGQSEEQLNKTLMPVYLYHYPTISSLREHMHFYQLHKTDRFAPFDEGFWKGQPTNPEEYPLENINIPIAIYYCDNDLLVDVADIQKLVKRLPNVLENNLLKNCNHMDPVIGNNVGKYLYERIIKFEELIEA